MKVWKVAAKSVEFVKFASLAFTVNVRLENSIHDETMRMVAGLLVAVAFLYPCRFVWYFGLTGFKATATR